MFSSKPYIRHIICPSTVIVLGLLMSLIVLGITGAYNVKAKRVYVVEGQKFTLEYTSNLRSSVLWQYKTVSGSGKWGAINQDERFSTISDRTGTQHQLIITDVHMRDAGEYGCVDDEGEEGYAELIVTDTQMKCKSNFDGEDADASELTSQDVHQDTVIMHCTIIYSGNIPPTLLWSLGKKDSVLDGMLLQTKATSKVHDYGRYSLITSEVTLTASRLLDNAYIKCQLSGSGVVEEDFQTIASIDWSSENIFIKCTHSAGCYIDSRHAAVIETDSDVYGITSIDDEIYVLQKDRANIRVYKSNNLKWFRNIHLSSLISPTDMTSLAYNKTLYIGDSGCNCIRVVDLVNSTAERRNLKTNYEITGLTVTAEHTLLVTVQISDTNGDSRVVEYTSEGQQVREIRYDGSILHAHQTLALSSDLLVVSHGRYLDSLHRVCAVNSEGKIQKIFGGKIGSSDGQLNTPIALAIDRSSKQIIYVADTGNNRIVSLDFDLNFLGQVRLQLKLKLPVSLYFDSVTKRLLAGDLSKRLLVISP